MTSFFLFLLFQFSCHPYQSSANAHTIFCRRCGTTITTTAHHHNVPHASHDITLLPEISPGAELIRFRNPNSVSFDIVTFKRATNIVVRGTPESKETFYPPYSWEPVYCKSCGAHVGWRFVADRKKDQTCPLNVNIPPMRPPDLSGSANAAAQAQKQTDLGSERESSTASSSLSSSDTTKKKTIKTLLSTLQGFCSTKQTGYWVYEWCFQRHVRQFHLEPHADSTTSLPQGSSLVTVAGTKYLKHPDWSLGAWNREAHTSKMGRKEYLWQDTRKKGETKEPKFVSHLHVGGQRCDETSDNRRTEVRLVCCEDNGNKKDSQKEDKDKDKKDKDTDKDKKHRVKPAWRGVSIRSIRETSVCRYRMEVCVPVLCHREDFRPASMEPPAPTKDDTIREQMAVYQQSQTQCVFYGLVWPRLLLQDSPSYKWIASVTPIVGVRRER